jgi:poly(3-hydroxybutyrate) depolymerase
MFQSIRNNLYALFGIILLNSGASQVQGASISGMESISADTTRFITWTYNETPMGLYIPKSSGKPLPLVMYLHFCTGSPVYPEFWIIPALNAIEPCAVFLPTAPPLDNNCADWGGTYDASRRTAMVNALHELDSIILQFGFSASRQYLYGESMGGEGVYRLLTDFPERFAGAVAVVGYTLDKGADKMAETPLWILHGAQDGLSPVENDRAIYKSILEAGGTNVKYTEYPGLDHVPAMEQARTEPGLLAWLLLQQRATGTSPLSPHDVGSFRNNVILSQKAGNLHFSQPLPQGTILTIFDLYGKMLYKVITSGETVSLPYGTTSRVALWHISHPTFSASGKILLVQR